MLPLDKQQSYGDAAAYEAQVKAYGITGYKMGKPVENGDKVTIVTLQETPQMPITYTWNFKKVGDSGTSSPAPWAARSSSTALTTH